MKDKTIAKYRSRKFLNDKFGMAAVQVSAHYNEYEYAPKNDTAAPEVSRSMDIDVTITDCNDKVVLEFSAYTEADRKAKIKKALRLIAELEKVVEILDSGEVGNKKGEWLED